MNDPEDATNDDDADVDGINDDTDHEDPRLDPVDGDVGMPGELIDSDSNLPGDQPEEDDPPTVSEVYGRDE